MARRLDRDNGTANATEAAARLLKVVGDVAAELHPHRTAAGPVTLDSGLAGDLGFDSLGLVELIMRVEQAFGVTLREQVFASAETPRDLLREVLGAGVPGGFRVLADVSEITLGTAEAAPLDARTLVDVLNWHALAHPDRPHIRFYSDDGEGEVITYGALKQAAERVAAGLQQRDMQPGEAVVIMLPTGRDYFFSFFGVLLAGGVPVPIYPPARPAQIEAHLRRHAGIVANCLAGILITVPEATRFARLLRAQVESLRTVVTPDELSSASGAFTGPALGAEDVAFLQYTSGSTGNPKGVVLTHGNLLANIRAMGEAVRAEPGDVFVSWLPLYHDMGLIGAWLGSLYFAALLVIMSPLMFLARPQRWLWAVHGHRGTLSAAPNFAYELCLSKIRDDAIKGLDLSSWRVACNGAEAVSPETVQRFCERFRGYGFRPETLMAMYGLAECSVGLAIPPPGRGTVIDRIERDPFMRSGRANPADETDARALRFAACGQPLPGHQIRIVDAAGRELPERHEGGLQFRGPSATSGYFRNAAESRRLFHGDWLESGDLAYIAGGDVYITGRTKDIIIRAGRNVYPAELEEAVGGIPGIRKGNVAVFGSTDPDSGRERLVVLAESRQKDPAALNAMRTQVNALAVDLTGVAPDDVVLAPPNTVLKTSSGKIRRAATREVYERGLIGKPRRAVWWQITRLALSGAVPQLRRTGRAVSWALYAAYAWGLIGLLVPILWVSVAVLPRVSWCWALSRRAVRLLARASGTPLMVQGLENLPPPDRACVFVSNHTGYLDGLVLIATLPRLFGFVAKAELTGSVITRVFLRRIEAEFVERFDKAKGADDARRMAHVVRSGRSLLFFPEGTFVRMPGLMPFQMGAFVAAAEAGVPVVPVAIRGTRSILRPDSWFPRRGAITVTVGLPIEPDALSAGTRAADTWSVALRLRDATRREILRHCAEPDLEHERSPVLEASET